MVRLQLNSTYQGIFIFAKVSIPLWFDYNTPEITKLTSHELKSQFHYGSITTIKILKSNIKQGELSQFHYGSITTSS